MPPGLRAPTISTIAPEPTASPQSAAAPEPAYAPPPTAGEDVPHIGPRGRLVDPAVTHEQRTFALLLHASIVLMHVLLILSFAVPLVMWLARRETSRFLDDHGRESINFHITIALYGLVGLGTIKICIGIPILAAAYLLAITGGVLACTAASRGEYFRYPMCIRLIRER